MSRILALLLLSALPLGALAATPAAPTDAAKPPAAKSTAAKPAAGKSEEDQVLFAIGQILSTNVKPFELSEHEIQVVQAGFGNGLRDTKAAAGADAMRPKIQALLAARAEKGAARAKLAGKAYRDKAAAAPGASTTPTGIVLSTVRAGTGAVPAATDQVKVHYEGRLIDGTVFDSSVQRG